MGDFLKRFWSIAVSLAGLVGAYLGAVPLHIVWLFWVVVGCSVVIAAITILVPRTIDIATRVRNYPNLLNRSAMLIDENERLKGQLATLQEKSLKMREEGISEGNRQVIGAIVAAGHGPLTLKGVALRQGHLLLIAESNGRGRVLHARYVLESELTGDVMGIVEVIAHDPDRKLITLECVNPMVRDFWDRLAENAVLDSSPPAGFRLVPSSIAQTRPSEFSASTERPVSSKEK